MLITRQLSYCIARHPARPERRSGFNQAHLFRVSEVPNEIRDTPGFFEAQGRPLRNAYYGDGSRIQNSLIAKIRTVYDAEL